jgi:hypothetical protein
MADAKKDDVYSRYQELHAQWSKDSAWKEHLDKLPVLVLAETIERSINRAISELKVSGKI